MRRLTGLLYYKANDKTKLMALDVFELIRRFLLRVLPSGFVKSNISCYFTIL
jgi:hypothetical protein